MSEVLKAPFPYFGGKSKAAPAVWAAFGGGVKNYVEPFAGSAAMLLAAPEGKRIETINDFDGFVANFWRALAHDPDAVAHAADWPVNEVDLMARHSWLVRHRQPIAEQLCADPAWYDARSAGWWVWGACNWIGSGWCSGTGPWVHDGTRLVHKEGGAGQGIKRQLPQLSNAGQGINRDSGPLTRRAFIMDWFGKLHERLRDVRVTCGDWQRVVKDSVTTRHGLTAVFLDPPYAEVFLENALKRISEIDILTDGGIIICERPVEKALADDFPGLTHWRDYKYGKTAVTIFRKAQRA